MKLKPRSTTHNPRGLLYRRFIGLAKSETLNIVYKTISTGQFWTFDGIKGEFELLADNITPQTTEITQVEDFKTIFQYKNLYYRFNGDLGTWQTLIDIENNDEITLLNATFNNIAQYQTNKYYFVGSFDWTLRGNIEGATTQFIKGNIMPITSMTIKHFDDNINIQTDDLVVIDKRLYSVENVEQTMKHQPKAFSVYFATLNSIL